jgi:hypothetical protein
MTGNPVSIPPTGYGEVSLGNSVPENPFRILRSVHCREPLLSP